MKTCIDLSIWEYILANYRNDLSCFDGSDDEKKANYMSIVEEFSILTENPSYNVLLSHLNDFNNLYAKLLQTEVCVTVLNFKYSIEHVNILKEMGYDVDFDPKNKPSWKSDIEKINRVVKNYKMQIEIVNSKLRELKEKSESQGKGTEQQFMDTVIGCSQNLNIKIDIKSTSLYEYSAYIRRAKYI